MKRLIAICAVIALLGTGYVQAETWTSIDVPGALATSVQSIDGGNLAGYYVDASYQYHGFLYSGGSWSNLDAPGAAADMSKGTHVYGIDGSNLVGYYEDNSGIYHGFLYDGTNWTKLDAPGAVDTYVNGISGNNLVGYSISNSGYQGFLYDSSTKSWTDIPVIGWGIDGSNIVGVFAHSDYEGVAGTGAYSGFLYNGTTYTTLDAPGADSTYTYGIDGSNIVGLDSSGRGLLYNLTSGTWTTFVFPGVNVRRVWDISGSTIVGDYRDASGILRGFEYEIPEPATLLLLGLGGLIMRKR